MAKHRRITLLLRILGFTLGGIATVVAAMALYIWLSFDVRSTQDALINYMLNHYQRRLVLDQDMALSLWPWPALEISQLTLSEPESATVALTLQHAHIELALPALLHQKPVIRQISIDNADAHLTRNKEGRWSIADLWAADKLATDKKDGKNPVPDAIPITLQPGQLVINHLSISVLDQDTKHLYSLKQARLTSGLLQPNAHESLLLQGTFTTDYPAMDGKLSIIADYALGKPRNGMLENIAIQFSGRLDDIGNSRSSLTADALSWTGAEGQLNWQMDHARAEIKGTGEQSALIFSAQLPQLKSIQGAWQADKASARLTTQHQNRQHTVQVDLQNLQNLKDQFKVEKMQFDWSISTKEQTLRALLTSGLSGNFGTGLLELPDIKGQASIGKEASPAKLEGNAKWNFSQDAKKKKNYAAMLNMGVLTASNSVQINAQIQTIKPLVAQLNVSGPRLDLASFAHNRDGLSDVLPELDSILKNVELTQDSSINLSELVFPSFTLQNVRIPLLLRDGKFSSISHNLKINDGLITGNMVYDATEQTMNWHENFSNVDLAATPKFNANELLPLSGKASGTLALTSQGNTTDLLEKNLKGNVQYSVSQAELSDINLEKTLHEFHAAWLAKKTAVCILSNDEKTKLDDARVVLDIEQGQIASQTLQGSHAWSQLTMTTLSDATSAQMQLTVNKTIPKDAPKEASDLRGKTLVINLKKSHGQRQANLDMP